MLAHDPYWEDVTDHETAERAAQFVRDDQPNQEA
jgi:hypothetical protein